MSRQLPAAPKVSVHALLSKMESNMPDNKLLWAFDASATRAKMAAYLDAGFTREEAFAIVMKDRK